MASRKTFTSFLECSLSLIIKMSSVSSFQRREAVDMNVLLRPAVFENDIATAAEL